MNFRTSADEKIKNCLKVVDAGYKIKTKTKTFTVKQVEKNPHIQIKSKISNQNRYDSSGQTAKKEVIS